MPLFTFIAYSALIVAVASFVLALMGKHLFYWAAAAGIYVFSFIAGFSIGQLTVGLTFVPLTMAIGYTFGWIKNRAHRTAFLCFGALIGGFLVLYAGDLLFYPLFPIFD